MGGKGISRALLWLTVAASAAAGAAAFVALWRLRDDPLPGLGAAFRTAAFLQPVPFAVAAGLAVWGRRRPVVLGHVLAAVVGCGAYGWWWLSGLEEVRRTESEPVRRNALGNILPDIEGEAGAAKALLWPAVVAGVIGASGLAGWAATRRPRPGNGSSPRAP
jgi:hypothetical protein